MSDRDWRFGADELGDTNDDAASGTTVSTDGFNEALDNFRITTLPVVVLGVYAFARFGAVLAAIEALIGAGGVATALTTALWLVGAVTLIPIALIVIIGAIGLIVGGVKGSPQVALGGTILLSLVGLAAGAALYLLPALPLLVAFVIVVNVAAYTVLLVGAILASLAAA